MTHNWPIPKFVTWLWIILITSLWNVSVAQTTIPPLNNGVMDSANVLKAFEKSKVDEKIIQFEREFGSQIAVLIIPQLSNEDIVDYGVRVMEEWQLGRKDIDDGALLIISINDRKTRLEVGYGLEGAIPDITAAKILNEYLAPHFQKQNYYQGIDQAIDAIIALIQTENLTQNIKEAAISEYSYTKNNFGFIFIIVMALVLLFYLYRWKPKATFLLSMSVAILAVFISNVYIEVLPASIAIGVCVFMFVALIHMLIHHPEEVSFSNTRSPPSHPEDKPSHLPHSNPSNTSHSQSNTSPSNANDRNGQGGKSGGGGATGGW